MPAKKKPETSSTVISFPIPRSGTGSDTDPRWQRVEALYGEIAKLDPRWFTDRRGQSNFSLLLEQTFCNYLASILIAAWDLPERAHMATLCQRFQHDQDEQSRQERLDRLRAGTPRPLDSIFRDDSRTDDEKLEDLVVRLQRRVEDLRCDVHRQQKGGAR